MIKKIGVAAIVAALLFSVGCKRQSVRPVEATRENGICLVENAALRPEAIALYRDTLTRKGYVVRSLSGATNPGVECPTYTTLSAVWDSNTCADLLSADLRVYTNGIQSGSASYKSKRAKPGRCLHNEAKLGELIEQLFPTALP